MKNVKLDIFPHIFPLAYFERMKRIAEGNPALAAQLKRRCGSGGTVKDGVIEIQGDHRDLVIEELKKKGWTVKRSGG